MKFINEVMGIGACNSTYSCAWCKCPSSERHDSTKKWSMVDPVKGARTISEIQRMSKLKKGKNASCLREPNFPFIPVHRVIPDPLHLFLRISDQLIIHLIQIMKRADNIVKNGKNVDKSLCTNLMAFEKFLQKPSIPWSIFTNKDTGQLQYRDFTGPEHKKIQQHINLDRLIPNHPKLESIKY